MRDSETAIICVDGMGIEWIGIIAGILRQYREIQTDIKIGRCNFPSVTETNRFWNKDDEVIRELDQTAHAYDYRFPDSFMKEIEIIKNVITKAVSLFNAHRNVLITSDHGLTRFSSFGEKLSLPENATVHKWGRYAELTDTLCQSDLWIIEDNKLMLAVHGRFEGGSGTSGESHGGALPEECIVPVIRLRKTDAEIPVELELKIDKPEVRLDAKGRGCLIIEVSKPVKTLILKVSAKSFEGKQKSHNLWEVMIENLKSGIQRGWAECDGQRKEIEFHLLKGIVEQDLGL